MRVKQVRKVHRQRRPGYPTRPEVARDPELLRRHMPSAWKKSAQVTAALSIMLALAHAQDAPPKVKTKHVAPIFKHGDGYAVFGGTQFDPPFYLSEDEAMGIITEEFKKAGISATKRDIELKELPTKYDEEAKKNKSPASFRGNDLSFGAHFRENPERFAMKGNSPLKMDLVDSSKGVAVEFVSFEDSLAMGGRMRYQTLLVDDILGVAEALSAKISESNEAPAMYYGVFYDPAANDNSRTNPKDDLRAQVEDFIEWLKGQGVL